MDKSLFTQKSISQFNSPDDLNDYIRVTNPGLWIIMAAMIVLLIGACVWGTFGRIESTVSAPAEVIDDVAVCTIDDREQLVKIEEGMTVKIGSHTGTVNDVDLTHGTVTVQISAPDGSYTAEIVKKSIAPISFITD